MDIKTIGAAVVSKIEHLIQPMVGRNDLAKIIGYIENDGAPSAVVPDFIGQRLFDTSGLQFYVAFGVASGEWTPMGASTLSAAELAVLDGALYTNAVASKAAIIDPTGILALSNNKLAVEAGAGITGGVATVYKSSVSKLGGIVRSSILLDLTGLASTTNDLDVIGAGTAAAYLGQITAARNGTILTGRVTCLEAPVGGVTDIDLYSAPEATGVAGTGIATLTETALVTAGGAWTLGAVKVLAAIPAANAYLYLTGGAAGTAATYTAGKFLIELEGYDA